MDADKTHALELLRQLAPEQVSAVVHVMEAMLDPLSRKLSNAPAEDEEISEDEERAVADARERRKHSKPVPHEEVLADFGLSAADFERMGKTPRPGEQNGSSSH